MLDTVKINHVQHISFTQSRLTDAVSVILSELLSYEHPSNPWEIFAYLPFGGWNECPNTPELMAVAKYWFEQYGAVPAVMTHDELEFLLPVPVSEKEAVDVAVELYGFCPDVIDQGPEEATVGALANVLRQSTVWYFWWD